MTKILFFSKDTYFCRCARELLLTAFPEAVVFQPNPGELPNWSELARESYDYVISFLSPWIIPSELLAKAERGAINFHPGPPEYPGIGCYNFALYDKVERYGVTCHLMNPKVDTGKIVDIIYFPVYQHETVESLKLKSMTSMLTLFHKVLDNIYHAKKLPQSIERWKRKPFTRKELNELCLIDPAKMSSEEINLRIKATSYPQAPGPYIEIDGKKFVYPVEKRAPIT